jgi:hypothetical protein
MPVEEDPSFRMAERFSASQTCQGRAKGAPPSAVARRAILDKSATLKTIAFMRTMAQSDP